MRPTASQITGRGTVGSACSSSPALGPSSGAFSLTSPAHRFERNPDGNPCDCSGNFPGAAKYKDPAREMASFASMLLEKEEMAKIEANKKAGDVPGAPGCYSGN